MPPLYTFDKIKFATDASTFERAVGLYESKKITKFKEELNGYFAIVLGTRHYRVYVDRRRYDRGECDCYLGQREILCKHMVAVAIRAVKGGKKLSKEDKGSVGGPRCSGKLGELSKEDLAETKKAIAVALRYIKPYNGPSRIWFAYQDSLSEGCVRLSVIVSELSVSLQTAKLLVNMLIRLDKKLCRGGVDDSDGTVGEFMYGVSDILQEFAKIDRNCIDTFKLLCDRESCFEWDEKLIRMYDERNIIV